MRPSPRYIDRLLSTLHQLSVPYLPSMTCTLGSVCPYRDSHTPLPHSPPCSITMTQNHLPMPSVCSISSFYWIPRVTYDYYMNQLHFLLLFPSLVVSKPPIILNMVIPAASGDPRRLSLVHSSRYHGVGSYR